MNTMHEESDNKLISAFFDQIIKEAVYGSRHKNDDITYRLNRLSGSPLSVAQDLADQYDGNERQRPNQETKKDSNIGPHNLGGRTERYLEDTGQRRLTRDDINKIQATVKRMAAERGIPEDEALELLERQHNFKLDIFSQTDGEEKAQDVAAEKIAKKLHLPKDAVTVTIGRIPSANSLWYNLSGVSSIQAAHGNPINASDRMMYTLGDYANCVQVAIDWGKKGDESYESLLNWVRGLKKRGLNMPGLGTAMRGTAGEWGEVLLWHLRGIIWGLIKNDMAEVGFNVKTDIIPAVRSTDDNIVETNVEDIYKYTKTQLGIVDREFTGLRSITQLRYAINSVQHRTDMLTKKLEKRAAAAVRGRIGMVADKILGTNIDGEPTKHGGLANRLFDKWNVNPSPIPGFTQSGGYYYDLLKELSEGPGKNIFSGYDLWKMSDLPTPNQIEKTKGRNNSLKSKYNEAVADMGPSDIIVNKIMPLFAARLDNTGEVANEMLNRFFSKQARRTTTYMEFEHQAPRWEVKSHNANLETTMAQIRNSETPYSVVQNGDGSMNKIHPYYTPNQYGIRPDVRTKFAQSINDNTPGDVQLTDAESDAISQLSKLCTGKSILIKNVIAR